ncbi:hypothetical protein [Rouxiella chamberiensis]|uniref:Transposase n=1 Tax=Rouxiella chamberiensis TaxID=1513468 RepID=A0ABY7HL99_9GAMM|nr:hypothetical protein [Rouxiella chamberiensis]WAT00090.1 hypothetical protein O1V66_13895 [Rouxiella chamberiensis]
MSIIPRHTNARKTPADSAKHAFCMLTIANAADDWSRSRQLKVA